MSLSELLQRQASGLTELLALLREEQDALVQGKVDGERLAQLASAKQVLQNTIESLENNRLGILGTLGYARNAAGSELAVSDASCLEQWQAVQNITRQAAHLNQLNGSLIRSRLAHNQHVLKDLRQLRGAPLYGADGQTHRSQGRIQSSA